jgi:hypothetical protein
MIILVIRVVLDGMMELGGINQEVTGIAIVKILIITINYYIGVLYFFTNKKGTKVNLLGDYAGVLNHSASS